MPDWLFHWTHDDVFKEVLKVSIPALGSILAALIAWYGIRRTAKVTQEALENSKEATPPELLRFEKWSVILKDLESYPKEIKDILDLKTIYSTYRVVLNRATLEDRINGIAVEDWEVRRALLDTSPGSGKGAYPKITWEYQYTYRLIKKIQRIAGNSILLCCIALMILIPLYYYNILNEIFVILFIIVIFITMSLMIVQSPLESLEGSLEKELNGIYVKNIIYRNCYHALRDVFLLEGFVLFEDDAESKEREKFEKTKEYKKWKKENPHLTSWNYGLSIDWDNNPYKNNTNGLEPNHLPPILFLGPKTPKRQES